MSRLAEHGQQAGRAALCDTIADLLLYELEEPLAARLRADPTLDRILRPPQDAAALAALRSDYARLVLLDVPPYASMYLDVPPVIGGAASRRWDGVLQARQRALASLERAAAPDHVGLVFRALAQAEVDNDIISELEEALRWLPQYLTAVHLNDPAGFYGRVGELATAALQACTQTRRLPAASGSRGSERMLTAAAPSPPEDDTLQAIVTWLSTPAQSGWYLAKPQLRRLAQKLGVATGVTDRESMLRLVFEASGLDGRTGELLDMLRAEHARWTGAAAQWGTKLRATGWSPALRPWRSRLDATRVLLTQLQATLQAGT